MISNSKNQTHFCALICFKFGSTDRALTTDRALILLLLITTTPNGIEELRRFSETGDYFQVLIGK